MTRMDHSLQLVPEVNPHVLNPRHRLGVLGVGVGMLLLAIVVLADQKINVYGFGLSGALLVCCGALCYFWGDYRASHEPGVKNHYIMFGGTTARGASAWLIGILLTGFYVVLYFYPHHLAGMIRLVDPLKILLAGESDVNPDNTIKSQWFLYGVLYTATVLVMGIRMLVKYRHSRYQMLRTGSVMFFQLGFAFLIPNILMKLNAPYYEWTNIWPLRYYELFPSSVNGLIQNGALGKFMVFWGIISILVITPVLTWFFGKRWYCSWVCGCGGLAETLGDPFRQNSDKSLRAWKIERILIYSVLVFVVLTTGMLWVNHLWSGGLLGSWSHKFSSAYGFLIGSIFAGVVGTGFYPIMGSRVWCRFGCPMAAILGILQRYFSRFRITTNGGQCISCGNCSTYCEMGIDVRAYAQRGENIVRASCVGCGVCSAVCPRGVLNLENGPTNKRLGVIPGVPV